jgi:hypothetical protein
LTRRDATLHLTRHNVPARLVAAVVTLGVVFAPTAHAKPTSELCESGSYRHAHPLICDTGATAPGSFPGGGGGGRGGLLGTIGRVLGGLTGGLL